MSGHRKWITLREQYRRRQSFRKLMQVSEEFGRIPVTVCTTHAAFVPCRHNRKDGRECVFSSEMRDVSKVFTIQNAIVAKEQE